MDENVFALNKMGQERLTSTALMNIEGKYCNEMLKYDVQKIIDAFGKKNNRASQFFKLTLTRSFVAV